MDEKKSNPLLTLLTSSVEILFTHPIVLYPFIITIFIELLLFEILYFAPRYPLSLFFAPIIRALYGETFLHYPFNLGILPKLFQNFQIYIYLFLSNFLTGMAILIIGEINHDKKITFFQALKQIRSQYVHIVVATFVVYLFLQGFFFLDGLLIKRALSIHSQKGLYFIIKKVVIESSPYVQLFCEILVTTIFAFVYPIIVLEKRKFFSAILLNFNLVRKSFFFIFTIVLLPTLLYLPVLLLRNNISSVSYTNAPELSLILIILSILIIVLIDAVIYTAITTFYLLKQENK